MALTDDEIKAIRKSQVGRYGSAGSAPYADSVQFARAIEAAVAAPLLARIAALTDQVEREAQPVARGELDPRTAYGTAKNMLAYVESFNGQKFGGVDESVDRQNLAVALDNLTETAAMLLNVSGRLMLPTKEVTRPLTTRELADVTAPWANIWTDQSFGIANAAIAKFCEVNGITTATVEKGEA